METEDLSYEAFQIMQIADRFDQGLTMGFTGLNRECHNENEFLLRSKELITDLRKYSSVFFEQSTLHDSNKNTKRLFPVLDEIEKVIKKTMRLPPARRTKRKL